MEAMTLGDIAKICGARVCGASEDTVVRGVSTDTRTISRGELFVPIVAARDGHDFIPAARLAGAAAVLSSREGEEPGTLYVRDTFEALKLIAREVRRRSRARVVAITGSSGKTTTKEMTASVLEQAFVTLKTSGNLNNTLGVPLTLLELNGRHEAAVVEMGMNHFGEILECATTAEPDVAVITNIGTAHVEFLGSREGIARAKLEMCEGMREGAPIILNGDEPLLRGREETSRLRAVYFGIDRPDCDVRAENIETGESETSFDAVFAGGRVRVALPGIGRHIVYDALAAFAVGLEYGVKPERIAAGLESYAADRQNIYTVSGFTIIDDCYNANPESMAAALEVLRMRGGVGRRTAVLGDMLELGERSREEHMLLVKRAEDSAQAVFLYGAHFAEVMESAGGSVRIFKTHEEIAAAVARYSRPGDTLLFKGSRSMHMERVLKLFLDAAC